MQCAVDKSILIRSDIVEPCRLRDTTVGSSTLLLSVSRHQLMQVQNHARRAGPGSQFYWVPAGWCRCKADLQQLLRRFRVLQKLGSVFFQKSLNNLSFVVAGRATESLSPRPGEPCVRVGTALLQDASGEDAGRFD